MKYISSSEGQFLLEESHTEEIRAREGAWSLTGKVVRIGVYWGHLQGRSPSHQKFPGVSNIRSILNPTTYATYQSPQSLEFPLTE